MRGLRCPQCHSIDCLEHHYVWVEQSNGWNRDVGHPYSCAEWYFLVQAGARDHGMYVQREWNVIQDRAAQLRREERGAPEKGAARARSVLV